MKRRSSVNLYRKAKRQCHKYVSPKLSRELPTKKQKQGIRSSITSGDHQQYDVYILISLWAELSGRVSQSAAYAGLKVWAFVTRSAIRCTESPPTRNSDRSPQHVVGCMSSVSASSVDDAAIERNRKDSKMVDLKDKVDHSPRSEEPYLSSLSWNQHPYLNNLETTIHFLEMFFAQSSQKVSIMFPRCAFTR
ncbi:hypothetical protein E4T44_00996 [Aureobasidium sp. EXF-8845]|nr:hypothetical protein E4T44_00996 [Aureobasidium sp. EXF-8845]KAI4857742.1 hypothetical protein E4T45_00756 [Aureobasidium sp. EXF-8846]